MTAQIAVLATLDTKGEEAAYLRERIETLGGQPILIDLGVINEPTLAADVSRQQIAARGGKSFDQLLTAPTRQEAVPVMTAGATRYLLERLDHHELDAVIGLGGTQGSSLCGAILQALPYGIPKILVSTVASGDTSSFVGIKDITMMFSVCDILGLNPLLREILSNAAAAAVGMGQARQTKKTAAAAKPTVGISNLGVLTAGTMRAKQTLEAAGYEVMVFHAVGSGGEAMEQMMKDGLLVGVFDYALGEIADALFGGLRAGHEQRLTIAARLGIPQVVCPGGAEHIGLFAPSPNVLPEKYKDRQHVFHSPIIVAPRLNPDEFSQVAREACRRLKHATASTCFLFPRGGTSRYSIQGGPLWDPASDEAFLETLRAEMPPDVELIESDHAAEDAAFVDLATSKLQELIAHRVTRA